jgi:hypothetical protein
MVDIHDKHLKRVGDRVRLHLNAACGRSATVNVLKPNPNHTTGV